MFYGTFEHALDDKHRLMIPSRLREQIPADEQGVFFVTLWLDGCLGLFTRRGGEELVQKVKAAGGSYQKSSARSFARHLFANTRREELDAQGRLLLSDKLCAKAGIRRDVVLVGVNDHIEVWDRRRWAEMDRRNQRGYERFAESSLAS